MKKYLLLLMIIILSSSLYGLTVPFSEKEIKTEKNHLSGFVRVSPEDSLVCRLATNVWLWHNGENLYVLWEAEIDEKFEKGTFAANDTWVDADFLRTQVITDVKNYHAYMFYAFPLGNKYDCIRNSDLNVDCGWNSTYVYKNEISGNLWKCLMIIPFKDLRFYGKPPYHWKIILTRYMYEDNDYYSVPYVTTKMQKDYFRKAINITINEEIVKSRNYHFSPYVITNYDAMNKDVSLDWDNLGLDFSFDPTFSTKVKLSINPDYSDVPLDTEQDIYNMRYAPTYSESRYFFIEDLDVFGVNIGSSIFSLFYSRNIMQPRLAFKMTGDTPNYSYGVLSAWDKEVKVDTTVTNPDDIYNMLAYRRKMSKVTLQFTLLNRMNKDYHNEVLHIMPTWEFAKNQTLLGCLDLSLRYKDDASKTAYMGAAVYSGRYKDINWNMSTFQISEDFSPDMGWINVTDIWGSDINLSMSKTPNKRIIKEYGTNVGYHRIMYNQTNNLYWENIHFNIWANTPQKLNPWLNYNAYKENYTSKLYDYYNFWAGLSWNVSGWLGWGISFGNSTSLVYDLEAVHKNRSYNFDVWGDISKYVSYSLDLSKTTYYDFPQHADSLGLDDEYWIGNGSLNITLSNNLILKSGLRYNNYESGDQTMHLGFFSNFRWEFKPDCNLYLGYKTVRQPADEIDNKVEAAYKQAYMKISYTF